jgi:uncharacterized phage infection (PIP) family protein YhgE
MEGPGLAYQLLADPIVGKLLVAIPAGIVAFIIAAGGVAIWVIRLLFGIGKSVGDASQATLQKIEKNKQEMEGLFNNLSKTTAEEITKLNKSVSEVNEITSKKIEENNRKMSQFMEDLARTTAEEISKTNSSVKTLTDLIQNLTGEMRRFDSRLTILEASVLTRDVLVRIETFLRAMSKDDQATAIGGVVAALSAEIEEKDSNALAAKEALKFGRRAND